MKNKTELVQKPKSRIGLYASLACVLTYVVRVPVAGLRRLHTIWRACPDAGANGDESRDNDAKLRAAKQRRQASKKSGAEMAAEAADEAEKIVQSVGETAEDYQKMAVKKASKAIKKTRAISDESKEAAVHIHVVHDAECRTIFVLKNLLCRFLHKQLFINCNADTAYSWPL